MNCDRIARWYRWMEYGAFGRELERRRLRFLAEATRARRTLVLGGGDGRFLAQLVRARREGTPSDRDRLSAPSRSRFGLLTAPSRSRFLSRRDRLSAPSRSRFGFLTAPLPSRFGFKAIDYVDVSAQMLDLARQRAGTDHVAYHHADALAVPLPPTEYDLIVTHFFLDCLNDSDASKLIERVSSATRPGARWIVSEFRVPSGGWRETAGRLLVSGLYLFFRAATGLRTARLVNYHALLAAQGFRLEQAESGWSGLVASECWVRVY